MEKVLDSACNEKYAETAADVMFEALNNEEVSTSEMYQELYYIYKTAKDNEQDIINRVLSVVVGKSLPDIAKEIIERSIEG